MDNKRYANDLTTLGFAANPLWVADDGRNVVAGDLDAVYIFGLVNVTQTEYLAFAVPIGLWLDGSASRWVLLPLITGPFALILMSQLVRRRGAALNRTLAATAMLLLLFGGLFSAGLATA